MYQLSYAALIKLEKSLFRAMQIAYRQGKNELGDSLHDEYHKVKNAKYDAYVQEFDTHFKASVVYS